MRQAFKPGNELPWQEALVEKSCFVANKWNLDFLKVEVRFAQSIAVTGYPRGGDVLARVDGNRLWTFRDICNPGEIMELALQKVFGSHPAELVVIGRDEGQRKGRVVIYTGDDERNATFNQ